MFDFGSRHTPSPQKKAAGRPSFFIGDEKVAGKRIR